MKLFKTIFGRVYAAPAPGAPDPDDDKANDGNEPGYPDNLREEDGNEPMECVYAGPDFFGIKDEPCEKDAAPEDRDPKDAPISCVYAGPRGSAGKRSKRNPPMGGVYAGPDFFASRKPIGVDPESGVYTGFTGMRADTDADPNPPSFTDDGLPPHVMGFVPARIPPEKNRESESKTVKCPGCGCRVADGMKFCPECGTRIEYGARCPECGGAVAADSKFCPECGRKLDDHGKKEDP